MNSAGFFEQHSDSIDERHASVRRTLGLAVTHHEPQRAIDAGLSARQAQILTPLRVEGDMTLWDVARVRGLSLAGVPGCRHRCALGCAPLKMPPTSRATWLRDIVGHRSRPECTPDLVGLS